MKDIDNYKEVEVCGAYNYDLYNEILESGYTNCNFELLETSYHKVKQVTKEEKKYNICIRGTRTDGINLNFICDDVSSSSRYSTKLVEGRLINKEDIEKKTNSAVIGDTLCRLLFGEESAIGKSIEVPIYEVDQELGLLELSYYKEISVVGVIKDEKNLSDYMKEQSQNDDSEDNLIFQIYLPLSFSFTDNYDTENENMKISVWDNEEDNLTDYRDCVQAIYELADQYGDDDYDIISYWSLKENMADTLRGMQQLLILLAGFMFAISGICIMNTMFFSVKERINEIGIRKAIGADDTDIILQFIFEGFVYGVIAAIIGILASIMIDVIVYCTLINRNIWDPGVAINIGFDTILLTALMAVFISVVASIIPAVYASKIKISDAIRYD
jgi:putative ABC transport system permease protein